MLHLLFCLCLVLMPAALKQELNSNKDCFIAKLLQHYIGHMAALLKLKPVNGAYSQFTVSDYDKSYIQGKTLLVEKFVCLRQRRSRILRGRSRAERPQESIGMKTAQRTEEGWVQISNRTNEEWSRKVISSTQCTGTVC